MKKVFISFIILFGLSLQAQQAKDTVHTEVIEVTHSFDPKVQDAYKLDVNPDIDQVTEKKIPVTYQIQSIPVASTFSPEKGGMANFNSGKITEDVYNSYVSIAGGNYTQIKGNAFVYYPVTQQLGTALHLQHYSSQGQKVDDGYSYLPFSHTKANLLFKYNATKSNWNMDVGYYGRANNFKEVIPVMPANLLPSNFKSKRSDNRFNFDISGAFNDSFIKDLNLSYNNYWDAFNNNENSINVLGNLVFPIAGVDLKVGLQTDLVTGDTGNINFTDTKYDYDVTYKNMDFGILPAVQIENDKLVVDLGAKIFYQNNETYKKVQFIPDVNLNFNLIYEKLTVFAGVTGDLKQNSYVKLSKNPYLIPKNTILPSLIPYDIFGGFNGAFSSAFSYKVKLGYRKINNFAFYMRDVIPAEQTIIVYDDMNQSYFQTAFNIGIGKKLDLKLQLDYMQNSPDLFDLAPYLPDYEFKSILVFKPTDKLNFNLSLQNLGNRNASDNDYSMSGFTDLNLGVRYNINKQFTAFIEGYNLLNKAYPYYFEYPVQKLQIMGGVAFRFDIPNNN